MRKNLGPQIIELLEQGFSKREIEKILNCSSSTICYHTSQGQKEKSNARGRSYRKSNPLCHKISFYLKIKGEKNESLNSTKQIKEILKTKIQHFSNNKEGKIKAMFTTKELLEKIGENPKCYLTGRDIDLTKSRSYQLDHIIPRSRGGDNSLDNCGLSCRDANQAKNDLLLEEFKQLCKDVISNLN